MFFSQSRTVKFCFSLLALAGTSRLFALQTFDTAEPQKEVALGPWLTGPLLTPSAHTVPFGHLNFEPYIYVKKSSHIYNKEWHRKHVPTFVNILYQFPVQAGLGKNWDCQFIPSFSWNHSKGQAKTVFNDLIFGFDYQLLKDRPGKWYPAVKLSLFETFPTGKYQHLNPDKLGTDIGGQGSFQTQFGITFGKVFHFGGHHWLSCRLSIDYVYLSPRHIEGVSAYGGLRNTHGKIFPGNQFIQLLGLEYTLSQSWALALDVENIYANKNRFSGFVGSMVGPLLPILPPTSNGLLNLLPPATPGKVGSPSSNQIVLAPAVEYNWNSNLGIIGGAALTVAGRNAPDYVQWIIAFNLYH